MSRSRGFTLIEVLVALAVLTVGGLGTLQLLDVLSRSNGNVGAEVEALAIARDLRAQLESVPLLRADLAARPAWTAASPVTAPVAGVTTIGPNVVGPNGGRYRVQYTRVPWTPVAGQGPDRDNDGAPDIAALDITITVDNPGAVVNTATRRETRLMRPVVVAFRKDIQESAAVAAGGVGRW